MSATDPAQRPDVGSGGRDDGLETDLRTDALGLLDLAPVAPPSAALTTRARQVARALARAVAPEALPEGARVGPYAVRGVLGRGGQATVYRAENAQGRAFAVKVPRPELVARLVREAQILFHLDHPRILRIEKADMTADPPYLACAFVPGGTLADRLRAGPLEPGAAWRLADQVLEALEHGHGKGVVHRDLKPSNVLFDAAGDALVADFGVGSLRLVEDLGLPQTLVSGDASLGVGTPLYMAPEQEHAALRADGRVDGRADLYALGKLLFEALTGRAPRTIRPASALVPGLDPAWDALLFRLVEDRPQDRFPDARAARAALAKIRSAAAPDAHRGLARPSSPRARPVADPTGAGLRAFVEAELARARQAVAARRPAAPEGGAPWAAQAIDLLERCALARSGLRDEGPVRRRDAPASLVVPARLSAAIGRIMLGEGARPSGAGEVEGAAGAAPPEGLLVVGLRGGEHAWFGVPERAPPLGFADGVLGLWRATRESRWALGAPLQGETDGSAWVALDAGQDELLVLVEPARGAEVRRVEPWAADPAQEARGGPGGADPPPAELAPRPGEVEELLGLDAREPVPDALPDWVGADVPAPWLAPRGPVADGAALARPGAPARVQGEAWLALLVVAAAAVALALDAWLRGPGGDASALAFAGVLLLGLGVGLLVVVGLRRLDRLLLERFGLRARWPRASTIARAPDAGPGAGYQK